MELEIVRGLTKYVGQNLEKEAPGPIVYKGSFGDYKRKIDKLANQLIENYLQKYSKMFNVPIIGRTEHKSKWIKFYDDKKEEIPLKSIAERITEGTFAIDVDEVDGTKNLQNKDRFTTAVAFNPKRPNMDGVICSSVYRWSGEEYFFDGKKSYYFNLLTKEEGRMHQTERIDEIDNTVKIRGCFITPYLWMWDIIANKILENFDLDERQMPCFCGNGTTTEDFLSTVLDRSIAIDPRALNIKAKRKPYAHDMVPPASIVSSLGVIIQDFNLKKFDIDLLSPNASVAFCAVPPGEVGRQIVKLLPEIKKTIKEILEEELYERV